MSLRRAAVLAALCACGPRIIPTDGPNPPPVPRELTGTLPASATPPRLVVLLVIDQLPQWAFAQKRPALTKGFARILREGEWRVGEHPSIATITASGHALLGTGETVSATGIVGNEWFDRASNKVVKAAEDEAGTVGSRWLLVPGLADAVAAAGKGGKAVGVALKSRAAILALGKTGTAVYYDPKSVAFRATAPAPWLDAFNAQHPIAPRLDDVWHPLDAARLAQLSGTRDDAPGEHGEKGFGPTFPHAHRATKRPAESVFASPLGMELTFAAALAAIEGEALGADAAADYLAVSISPHDYVGHGWGHESWEAWDMLLRIDEQLGAFLAALDARVGADRWSMIVTSDHGASPSPIAHGGGAITKESLKDAANRAAITQLGPGNWIAYASFPTVYLSAAARARSPKDQQRALVKIVYALRAFPGISHVELTRDVIRDCPQRTGAARITCLGLHPERSGEVYFHPRPYWIFDEQAERLASAHGSLHAYDREVPVLVLPPGRRPHAPATAPADGKVPIAKLTETIAGYLGVPAPTTLPR